MRLVHDEQGRPGLGDLVDHRRVGQLLRREEEELQSAVLCRVECLIAGPLPLDGGNPGRATGGVAAALDGAHLVPLQREQRRHHDGGPADDDSWHLVDRGFAGAGRHHRERVAAGEDGGHRLQLTGTQVRPTEDLTCGPPDASYVVCHGSLSGRW